MKTKNFDICNPDWKKEIPQVIFDEKPEYIELYNRAWELAHDHVLEIPGMPQTPYMDEAFLISDIWIWDTCFMMFFCKYAPHIFPGIETLNNFYGPLHDDQPLPMVKSLIPRHGPAAKMAIWCSFVSISATIRRFLHGRNTPMRL